MTNGNWITRSVSHMRPVKRPVEKSVEKAQATLEAAKPIDRSTHERLKATLRRNAEALSPRVLRRTLTELQAIVESRVSEVEGGRRAKAVAQWYKRASLEQRHDCWLLMSEQFMADPQKAKAAKPRCRHAGVCCSALACLQKAFGFWWICALKCCRI
jgi:malonyl-CoA decarboxylase